MGTAVVGRGVRFRLGLGVVQFHECEESRCVRCDFGWQWRSVEGSDSHDVECGSGYRQICSLATLSGLQSPDHR